VALKARLLAELERLGYRGVDVGATTAESTDYPDFAHRVARAVETGEAKRGVLVCGTGVGMAMAANRHPGVRAAVAWNPDVAELVRRHNDANVLTLGARVLDEEEAVRILERWLDAPFDGGRHVRRVHKIEEPG
jgi:ribose 5-phosphate isomerase B